MMIQIVDALFLEQPVVAVVDAQFTPPKILSLRKGSYDDGKGHHETSCAEYHAKKCGQSHIEHVKLYDSEPVVSVH